MRRRAAALAFLAAAAACFSDRPEDPTGPGGEPDAVVTMTDQLAFEPVTTTIRAGQTVLWRNTSSFVHTATGDPDQALEPSSVALPAGADPWDSGAMAAGTEYRKRFDVPGEYAYFCDPHELQGMLGRIVVTDD